MQQHIACSCPPHTRCHPPLSAHCTRPRRCGIFSCDVRSQSHGNTVRLGCPVDGSFPVCSCQLPHPALRLPRAALSPACRNADLAARRKPPAQKAWTQGTNPLTQRPTNPTPSNGIVNPPKPTQNSTGPSGETNTPMRHLSDRMMYLLANLTVSARHPANQQ
jgi:hypothetical protein